MLISRLGSLATFGLFHAKFLYLKDNKTAIKICNKFENVLCVHHAATWVGGTFIIGTAETVYDPKLGLTWAVMPLAATVAFILGKMLSLNL